MMTWRYEGFENSFRNSALTKHLQQKLNDWSIRILSNASLIRKAVLFFDVVSDGRAPMQGETLVAITYSMQINPWAVSKFAMYSVEKTRVRKEIYLVRAVLIMRNHTHRLICRRALG